MRGKGGEVDDVVQERVKQRCLMLRHWRIPPHALSSTPSEIGDGKYRCTFHASLSQKKIPHFFSAYSNFFCNNYHHFAVVHLYHLYCCCPSGIYEALELRDKEKGRWHGKGVTKAIENINNTLGPELVKGNLDPVDQTAVDDYMLKIDGTENKTKLGANAILGVSMAVCKAGAAHRGVPLYRHIADLAGIKVIENSKPTS